MAALPKLTKCAQHYPDCCLGLGSTMLNFLHSKLAACQGSVLSIGSGSGLLEAYLLQKTAHDPAFVIRGIEIDDSVNKHLPEEQMLIVAGSWSAHDAASHASAWMFVYPRKPQLIKDYLEQHWSSSLKAVIWLGPRVDWTDFAPVFDVPGLTVDVVDDCGMAAYEMMANITVDRSPS